MIKANELRIGNLIILPNGDIGKISYHEIRLMVVAIEKPDYQPIPLTEEWLLRFGIDFTSEKEWYHLTFTIKDLLFETSSSIKGFTYNLCFDNQINFQYVHQLQNLYFCLCGEELTIKEVNNEQ
jgi:hypothetical protein